jgi:hypothetical protein
MMQFVDKKYFNRIRNNWTQIRDSNKPEHELNQSEKQKRKRKNDEL